MFADVLLRAAESERIRAKLALLKQYDSLFRLPPRIRDATRRGDYEQVRGSFPIPLGLFLVSRSQHRSSGRPGNMNMA